MTSSRNIANKSTQAWKNIGNESSTKLGTKFCHPDRYKDRVSQEVIRACGGKNLALQFALAVLVRYRSSPRGLATSLARRPHSEWSKIWRRRGRAYRQTGTTDEQLHKSILNVGDALARVPRRISFQCFERKISAVVKRVSGGTKGELFAARQVAADMVRVAGFCADVDVVKKRPLTATAGPGARIGFAMAARSEVKSGVKRARVPAVLPFQQQTEYCEYHKLCARLNFPHLAKRARYTPASARRRG